MRKLIIFLAFLIPLIGFTQTPVTMGNRIYNGLYIVRGTDTIWIQSQDTSALFVTTDSIIDIIPQAGTNSSIIRMFRGVTADSAGLALYYTDGNYTKINSLLGAGPDNNITFLNRYAGNVCIGSTTSPYKLTVIGDGGIAYNAYFAYGGAFNVGIGTTTATEKLTVDGDVLADTVWAALPYDSLFGTLWKTTAGILHPNESATNVSIGSTTAPYKLYVVGTAGVTSTLNCGTTIELGSNAGSGTLNMTATDGDVGSMAINTSDALNFTGFGGGVDIDAALTVGSLSSDAGVTAVGNLDGDYLVVDNWVHMFHYFGDSTISKSYTTNWAHLTNAGNEMWIETAMDGFTVSNDTITILAAGYYDFLATNTCDGDNGETVSIRFYNVTEGSGIPVASAATMRTGGNYYTITTSGYSAIDAGDKVVLQYKGDASGTSIFKNGTIKIIKIHE